MLKHKLLKINTLLSTSVKTKTMNYNLKVKELLNF